MKRTFNLLVLVTLLALAFGAQGVSPAHAAPTTVTAYYQGWYEQGGSHWVGNLYTTVGTDWTNWHNFFVFDLSSLSGTVTSATLRFYITDYSTGDPSETMEFYDVSTSIASLLDGSGGVPAYIDLGSGTLYGNVVITSGQSYSSVDIPLNASGVAAIQTALGGNFAIGGLLSTDDGNDFLNGYSQAAYAQLIVDIDATSATYDLDVSGSYNYIRSQPAIDISSLLTATSTPAGELIDGANVLISSGFLAGDTLAVNGYASPWNGISWSYDGVAGVMAFTGSSSIDNYQTLLRAVTFNTSAATGARTVDFTLGAARPYSGTGHYYDYVPADIFWSAANTAASSSTYFGRQGYLATITSAGENDFVTSKLGGAGAWLGGNDAAVEGTWNWVTGPEAGTTFCSGPTSACASVGGAYLNWGGVEPNDAGGGGRLSPDRCWRQRPVERSSE